VARVSNTVVGRDERGVNQPWCFLKTRQNQIKFSKFLLMLSMATLNLRSVLCKSVATGVAVSEITSNIPSLLQCEGYRRIKFFLGATHTEKNRFAQGVAI